MAMSTAGRHGPWDQLRALRAERGLTQAQLAAMIPCSRASICRLEAGHDRPRVSTTAALAAALGVPVEDLAWRTSTDSRLRDPVRGCVRPGRRST